MPRQTSRMEWSYPAEGDDPYFDTYVGWTNDLDASGYAEADNNNILLIGDATFSWDVGTEILSWDDDWWISGFTTGVLAKIPGPDQITFPEGKLMVVTMPRLLQSEVELVPQITNRVSEADGIKIHDKIVLAYRRNNFILFRNSVGLRDGVAGKIWERPPTVGILSAAQRNAINSALHEHPVIVYEEPATLIAGSTSLPALPDPAPEQYFSLQVFRNGGLLEEGASADYTYNPATRIVTIIKPVGGVQALDKWTVIPAQSVTVPLI